MNTSTQGEPAIPDRLRAVKERYNLTWEDLAVELSAYVPGGITKSAIDSYLQGRRAPSAPVLRRLKELEEGNTSALQRLETKMDQIIGSSQISLLTIPENLRPEIVETLKDLLQAALKLAKAANKSDGAANEKLLQFADEIQEAARVIRLRRR